MSRKNAKELMLEFTAFSFRVPKKAAELFAEDGTFAISYLPTFGVPSQYKGRDAIAGFFQSPRYLGSDSYDRIALANKIAGEQPTKFSSWARLHIPIQTP